MSSLFNRVRIQIEACLFKHHFYRRSHSKMASKEHCMYIKQKQNISSQSFLRSPSTLKSSFQFVCNGAQNLSLRLQTHLLPCDLCNTRFTSSQALQLHLEENHLEMTMDCQEESGMAINAIFNLFHLENQFCGIQFNLIKLSNLKLTL